MFRIAIADKTTGRCADSNLEEMKVTDSFPMMLRGIQGQEDQRFQLSGQDLKAQNKANYGSLAA